MYKVEELYNDYFHDVYLYIRSLSADEHLAEDITQETFFKAMKSVDSFRGDCDIRVWLCQIAKNLLFGGQHTVRQGWRGFLHKLLKFG